MTTNPLKAYRQTHVKTSSQGKLIIMLYDESIKQLQAARDELERQQPNLESAHNAIIKAQDIITELMVSLDFENGNEIARNLFHLYMYFNQILIDANISKNPAGLIQVSEYMVELRDAWNSIEGTVGIEGKEISRGINLAG